MPGFPRLRDRYDLVVLGGGHAGLQAAAKAGLLRRRVALIDRGPKYSRSYYAPKMDNIPGFPEGVSGHRLLDTQVAAVRALSEWVDYFSPARASAAVRTGGEFEVRFEFLKQTMTARGRALVLAMGVVDRILEVDGKIEPIFPWANQALVDFCLVCDGHELAGRSVGVLGHDAFAARTALDLFEFAPSSVEVLTHGHAPEFGAEGLERTELERALAERHVPVVPGVIAGFDEIREHRFGVRFADGSHRSYDRGFSALGWYRPAPGAPPRARRHVRLRRVRAGRRGRPGARRGRPGDPWPLRCRRPEERLEPDPRGVGVRRAGGPSRVGRVPGRWAYAGAAGAAVR